MTVVVRPRMTRSDGSWGRRKIAGEQMEKNREKKKRKKKEEEREQCTCEL